MRNFKDGRNSSIDPVGDPIGSKVNIFTFDAHLHFPTSYPFIIHLYSILQLKKPLNLYLIPKWSFRYAL